MDDASDKDDISHVLALKACILTDAQENGQQIHISVKSDDSRCSIQLKGALIEFYGHFLDVAMMQTIFNSISAADKNSVCVGAMMKGYAQNEMHHEALRVYDAHAALHNNVTHVLALTACLNSDDRESGAQIIGNIKTPNLQLRNVMIDFYGHFGDIANAEKIFRDMDEDQKDVVSVNSIMQSYFHCNRFSDCLRVFESEKMSLDAISYSIALKACTESASYHLGQRIDELLRRPGNESLRRHLSVQINLIEYYGKCGLVDEMDSLLQHPKRQSLRSIARRLRFGMLSSRRLGATESCTE